MSARDRRHYTTLRNQATNAVAFYAKRKNAAQVVFFMGVIEAANRRLAG